MTLIDNEGNNQAAELLGRLKDLSQSMESGEIKFEEFVRHMAKDAEYDPSILDLRGRAPLHNAALRGHKEAVEHLLAMGADPNQLDRDGCSPLALAIREENMKCAFEILEHPGTRVDIGGGQLGSVLHSAVPTLDPSLVRELLEKGAAPNHQDTSGYTPIHFLINVFSKNPKKAFLILRDLISFGGKLSVKNCEGWSPLHLAIRKQSFEAFQAMLHISNDPLIPERVDLNEPGGFEG